MSNDAADRPVGRWSDHEVEQLIGRLLQVGVLVAAGVVLIGGVMLLVQHGGRPAEFATFSTAASPLQGLAGIFRGAVALDSMAIVQLGLVLLIATPVMRVALTLVAFALQRDRLYILLTAVVLGLLLYGLVWGRA
ncbi:MAG TPA: DUF1634 domain-containing protein [Gemmatimonadaceae bacterium]|nr:DUF1634 domain-containing protein [Gemmatimonadaceae bacterium]